MESQLMFAPLATPHSRWKSFLVGWGLWAQIVVAVLLLNAILPKQMQQVKKYVVTNLMAPVEPVTKSVHRVNPRVAIKPALPPIIDTPAVAKLIVPRQVRERREQETDLKPPDIKLTSKPSDLSKLANASIPKVIATNQFATPTDGISTNSKPAVQVQTGGFGDPHGVAAISDGKHDLRIAAKGEAGLPKAAGFGDGLGGPVGVGGVRARGNGIQSSGFDKQYEAKPKQTLIASNEPASPVEIIEKPRPSYTEEARKLGVQGEVRLEVQFTADGHIRVLRVLQGLGFGLDEQALRCAEHIRFKPATHSGQAIDSTAVVHIVFELVS